MNTQKTVRPVRPSEEALSQEDIFQQEEKCLKSIRTVRKAVFMRLFVTVLLIWAALGSGMEAWAIGLLVLVMIVNLTGLLPLIQEWRKQKRRYQEWIEMEEE